MPYKRRRQTRRPMKRRRGFKRRRTGWGGYLRTGLSLARQVWKLKGLVNSEMYKYDLVNQTPSPGTTGTVTHLTSVAQGDGDGNRTGNSIFVRALNIRGHVQRNSAGSSVQIVRIAIIMDTQQIADSAPVFSDIYEGTDVLSHLNSDTVGRFKVLYNQVITLDSVSVPLRPFQINLPMRHHVRYNGVNGTDIQRGALYFVAVSSQASANYPAITFDARLSYHDN